MAASEEVNDVSDVLSLTNGILLSLWILLVGWRWVGPTLMTPFVEGPFVGELSAVEIAERVLLLIIFGVAALGAVFGRRIVASRRIMHFVSAPSFSLATAAVFVFALGSVTYWDSFKGELWFGYGLGFAMICAIGAVLLASIAGKSGQRQWFGKRTLKWISITTGIFGLCMYLPSVIQPTTGIIDLSHSRYLLNETLAQVAGVTPLGDFSPHYTSLLGWPLVLLGWLPAKSIILATLAWVNLLILIEIFVVWRIARHAWDRVPQGVTLLFALAFLLTKVQPSETISGSNASLMTVLPGRSLMPMALGLFAILLTKREVRKFSSFFFIGAFAAISLINAFDFGFPATVALVLVTAVEMGKEIGRIKALVAEALGGIAAIAAIFGLFAARGLTPRFADMLIVPRAVALRDFYNLPMPVFGLYLATIAMLIIGLLVGILGDFRATQAHLRTSLIYGSTWGILSFTYYIGRSVNSNLQLFLFHSTFIVFALGAYLTSHMSRPLSLKTTLAWVPALMVVVLPVISLSQPPNPRFEIDRWRGYGPNFSIWSPDFISEGSIIYGKKNDIRTGSVEELLEAASRFPGTKVAYFGENGNAVSLLTGLPNVLSVNALQDLDIPGIREAACRRLNMVRPDVVLMAGNPDGQVNKTCSQMVLVGNHRSVEIYRVVYWSS